jgi:GNAT superfamily N-acetyltransferase
MKIIDLPSEHEAFYFKCLVDDPAWLAEAGDYKRKWYEAMKPRGLRVKLALNDGDRPVGMVQYLPVEESNVSGRDLFFLHCIWVVNDRRGANRQGKGIGSALLAAFEEDARCSGKKGVVVWGVTIPDFMRAAWFKKHGYETVEAQGIIELLWKTWEAGAVRPAWVKPNKKPAPAPGGTTVTCFRCGWCPEVNKTFTRARRAAADLAAEGRKVGFREIDTTDRRNFREWGISDALFIDGEEVPLGPAPSYEQIKEAIERSLKKAKEEGR